MSEGKKKIYTLHDPDADLRFEKKMNQLVKQQEELAHNNMSGFMDFIFNDATSVRIIKQNNEPWFCGPDVGKILGYVHIPDMYRMLPENEKGIHIVNTLGGPQKITFISLSGLFRIISASRRLEAVQFWNWVCIVVLPSIYTNGAYMSPNTINKIDNDSNYINELKTECNDSYNNNMKLLKELEELKNINETLSNDNIRLRTLFNMEEDYTELGKHIVDVVLKKMQEKFDI